MGRQAPYEQIFIPAEARIQFYAKPTSRGKNPDHFMLEFNDPAAAEPVKLVVRIVPNSGIKVKRVRGGVKAVAGRLQGAASVLNGTN